MSATGPSDDTVRTRVDDPASREFRLGDYPFYLMARTSGLYNAVLERALKAIGMDQPRWRVLMLLQYRNPAPMGYLAEHAVIKHSTLTRIAKRMEAEGLITSQPGSRDARITDVFITDRGHQSLAAIRRILSGVYDQAVRGIDASDLEQLRTTLRQMEDNLRDSAYDVSQLSEAVGESKR